MTRAYKVLTAGLLSFLLLLNGCTVSKGAAGSALKETNRKPEGLIAVYLHKIDRLEGYSYRYTIDINGQQRHGQVWVSGPRRRAETVVDGQRVVLIYDARLKKVITYYSQKKRAIRMGAEDTPDLVAAPDDYLKGVKDDRLKVMGLVAYQDRKCRVLVADDDDSGARVKLWVDEITGLPLRVESVDAEGNLCVVAYDNVVVKKQPSSLFKLPQGTRIIEL